METKRKSKGSRGQQFFFILLGIVLGVLLYWLLDFITRDIGTMRGPDYSVVRNKYIDATTSDRQILLKNQVQNTNRRIKALQEQQRILKDSTTSLQNTINQLLTIQTSSVQKNIEFPEESTQTIRESQTVFLENQKKYEEYNQQMSTLMQQLRDTEDELAVVNGTIAGQEKEAKEEYQQLMDRHRLKVAALKLTFLVPVFLVASYFFQKKRTGIYWPIVWTSFISVFLKMSLVIHEYFPKKYFKYIALLVMMGIVLKILIYLMKRIVSPKKELLIRQYQQHYDKMICPICSKPIRTGLLTFTAGLKHKYVVLSSQNAETVRQGPYTCPSCGTNLYNKCEKCGQVRHTLLPYCEHCGAEESFV